MVALLDYLESNPVTKPYIARHLQAIQLNNTRDWLEAAQEIGNLREEY